MNVPRTIALVVLATAVPMVAGYSFGAADAASAAPPLGPGVVTVELETRYSRYSIPELRVYEGTLVRFVVANPDPIHHELIVGPEEVHARHEGGHEATHPPVPGEVSIDPGERGLTTYLFDQPGTVQFACHLPRHLAYGMEGRVEVTRL